MEVIGTLTGENVEVGAHGREAVLLSVRCPRFGGISQVRLTHDQVASLAGALTGDRPRSRRRGPVAARRAVAARGRGARRRRGYRGRAMADVHGQPHCFGCGAENPAGLQIALETDGPDALIGSFTPSRRHEGAPGIMHGGVMTAVFDEVLGQATKHCGHRGVTASLTVQFRAPVPVGRELRVHGRVECIERRKLHLAGEAYVGDLQVADATGLWVEVPQEHFDRHAGSPPPVV